MTTKIKTKYGIASLYADGYYRIISNEKGNMSKPLHRLIFEDFYKIKLPSNIQIHHDDGDKTNNNIWNLIPLTRGEHASIHHKGKTISEEVKRKMSISTSGANNPNYGKPLSEETKRKLSESHKGKLLSKETRFKIGMGNSKTCNSTGFKNVSTRKVKSCKQGFSWRYMLQCIDKKCDMSAVNLLDLKRKVLKKGYEWEVVDEVKAIETCEKYGYDYKELC